MSKNKKKEDHNLNFSPSYGSCDFSGRGKPSSIFEDDNCEFDHQSESDEWRALWKGTSSIYDDIDPDEEYQKASTVNKEKRKKSHKKPSVFDEDDDFSFDEQETDLSSLPPPVPPTPSPIGTQVRAVPSEDDEVSDRALCIAEDFLRQEHAALVGEALYIYSVNQ